MVSRRHVFNLLAVIIISLLAVACERPIDREDAPETEITVTDSDVGGGVDGQTEEETAAEPGDEQPATDETPAEGGEAPADTAPDEEQPATDEGGQPAEVTTDEQPAEDTTTDDTAAPADEAPAEDTADAGGGVPEETSDQPAEDSASTTATDIPDTHTVAAGENLYRIGLKYGISWVAIANYNNLANPNRLTVGQVLNLPKGTNGEPPTPPPTTETTYTVKAGDNLYRIGLAYGISWIQIAEANGILNPNQIRVGDILKIPVNTPGPSPQFTHTVKPGETLFLISLQYGVPWPAIADQNNISSPYVIFVGQTLVIPGGG